jgi:beta-lactamase regulating signal transducer with metallopeptidase domain
MSLDSLFVHHALDVWTAAIWRASWQGGVAAIIVACLCRLLPSIPARFQCWLWRLVMLKFAISFFWSAPIEIPVLPQAEPIAAIAAVAPSMPTPFDELPLVAAPSNVASTSCRIPWLLIPFLIWAAVVAVQLGRIGVACRNARLLRTRCRPSDDRRLLEPCSRFSAMLGLSSPPHVLETEGRGSPLLVGILRPAIVLPTTTLSRLDSSERSLVLGHELAHISRRDLFCSLVAAIIRALFFFHPAAWLGERRLALSQEIAADQLAISLQNQSPTHYARLLLAIVAKLGTREANFAMSIGAAGEDGSLYRRLSAMRYISKTTPRIVLTYGLLIGLVGILGLVHWSLVAAPTAVAAAIDDEPNPMQQPEQTNRTEQETPANSIVTGRYLSFEKGVLKVTVRDEQGDVETQREWRIADDFEVLSHHRGGPKRRTAREALKQWKPGGPIAVTLKDGAVDFLELGRKSDATAKSTRAPVAAPEKKADPAASQAKTYWGRFVSFNERTLTIETNARDSISTQIPADAKASVWNGSLGKHESVPTTVALTQAKVGSLVAVSVADSGDLTLRIGARKGATIGTFVSYKDGRLQIAATNLGEQYTKKYGNVVRFNKFRNDVPAFRSIDGGEYRPVGTANEALTRVRPGTIVTVHGEGDDNTTLVQIGVPKK